MQPGSASLRDQAWASIHHLNTLGLNHCRSLQYQIESPGDWPWLLDHRDRRGDPSCRVAPNTSAWWGSPQGSGPGQLEKSFYTGNTDHIHVYPTEDLQKWDKNLDYFFMSMLGFLLRAHYIFKEVYILINPACQMEPLLNSLPDRFPSGEEPMESVWRREAFLKFGEKNKTWKVVGRTSCLSPSSRTISIFTASLAR